MLIRHMKRQHNGMAQPSGGGDGRRPRPRPRNGTAPGATWRRGVRELCCDPKPRMELSERTPAPEGGRSFYPMIFHCTNQFFGESRAVPRGGCKDYPPMKHSAKTCA